MDGKLVLVCAGMSVVVGYYCFFTCLWIRNLLSQIFFPIPEVPNFVDACSYFPKQFCRSPSDEHSPYTLTSIDQEPSVDARRDTLDLGAFIDANTKALVTALAACVIWAISAEIFGFAVCYIFVRVLNLQASYSLIAVVLVLVRMKILEVNLSRRHIPELHEKTFADVFIRFIKDDFMMCTGTPFAFILGGADSIAAVSHGIFLADAWIFPLDGVSEEVHAKFRSTLLAGFALPEYVHLWHLVLLTACVSFVWLLGLTFEPTNKPGYTTLLMRLLGFGGLERQYMHFGYYKPDSASAEFWSVLDYTIVITMGSVLPNLWWQQTRNIALMGMSTRNFITTFNVFLGALMMVKQGVTLTIFGVNYFKRYEKKGARFSSQRSNQFSLCRNWDLLYQAMAVITFVLMVYISIYMSLRYIYTLFVCRAEHIWSFLNGCGMHGMLHND